MSTYDKEIFRYLTKKENYTSAIEIASLLPEINKKLIIEFWPIVQKFIEKRISESLHIKYNWEVTNIMDIDIFERWSALELWFNDDIWVAFSVLHGQLAYGLMINYDNQKLDRQKMEEHTSKISRLDGMKRDNWWLARGEFNEDFKSKRTLIKILPENRDLFAAELADYLFDFGEELGNDIIKMEKMTK